MEFNEFKALVTAAAQRAGIGDYELYYEAEESTDVSMFNGEIDSFTSALSGGAAFRCIVGGHMGTANTQELSESQAESLVHRAYDNALTLEKDLAANEALKLSHEKITDRCSTEAVTQKLRTSLFNSNGVDLSWEAGVDLLVMSAVVADGEEVNDDYDVKAGDPAKLDLQAMANKTAAKAAAKLGAKAAPTGAYPVIFSGEAMSSLLSTFSSAFSAENARKGLSALKDKEGEVIAAPLVTIIDDPFYPGNALHRNFDGEGSPVFRKEVIDRGVLKTLLYDLSTAHAAGKETTGNASRLSYDSSVSIQPYTFLLSPGELTEEELLAECGDGVWIDFLGGLHAGANPISGDFSLQSGGFIVEKGRKTRPVSSFTVSGNFFELLKNVRALSDKAEIPNAFRLTAYASPAVLVDGLTVSGA